MKLKFRQGIIRCRIDKLTHQPDFLQYNPTSQTVNINIFDQLDLAITFAHGPADYLYEERLFRNNAWGQFHWQPRWGPTPNEPVYYLYWNVNLSSGEVTRLYTPKIPSYGPTAPVYPQLDDHWFDTVNGVMKNWNGSAWGTVIRVFAGTYHAIYHTITHYLVGSQVGITYPYSLMSEINAGYILYGMDQKGIRSASGQFLTSDTPVMMNMGAFTSPIKLEAANTLSIAAEPIPEYYLITSVGDNTVALASNQYPNRSAIGLSESSGITGQEIKFISHGVVFYDGWTWDISDADNLDLYCGPSGELLQGVPPSGNIIQRIGTVLSKTSITLNIDTYATGIVGPGGAGGSGLDISFPITQTDHNFEVGQPIYFDGSDWLLAKADSPFELGLILVKSITDSNHFIGIQAGMIAGLSGLVPGDYYFVSDVTEGALTNIEPPALTSFSNPILFALTTTSGLVVPFRPSQITETGLGPTGPTGGTGGGLSYVHTQAIADTTWTIAHNQNSDNFVITVFDVANNIIIPESVIPINSNSITVTFADTESGKAVIFLV